MICVALFLMAEISAAPPTEDIAPDSLRNADEGNDLLQEHEDKTTGRTSASIIDELIPRYPKDITPPCVAGEVMLAIDVNKGGRSKRVKVLKPLHPHLDELSVLALRAFRWKPATNGGVPIASKVRYRFRWDPGCQQPTKKTGAIEPASSLSSANATANKPRQQKFVMRSALTREEIESVLRVNKSRVRRCYERELDRSPSLEGKMVIQFVIGPQGRAIAAKAKGSGLVDPRLEKCITDVFFSLRFKKPRGGGFVHVNYPYLFNPGKRPHASPKPDPIAREEDNFFIAFRRQFSGCCSCL